MLIKEEIRNNLTDVPEGIEFDEDVELIEEWEEDEKAPNLSEEFKIARSIRFISVNEKEREKALKKFDNVV